MKESKDNIEAEWSYLVDVKGIDAKGQALSIEPTEAERTRLIRRLGLLALDDCQANLKLSLNDGHIIHVKGVVTAKARQSCVMTLETVETAVREEFEAWYADPQQVVSLNKARRDQKIRKGHVEIPLADEREDPEPIVGGKIDVGELVTQYLSLGIDPYPRAPGVELPDGEDLKTVHEDPSVIKNPFAALKDWKDKLK